MTVLGSSRWRLSGRVGWGGEPEAERAAQVKGSGSVGTERKELEEEMILGGTKSTPVQKLCTLQLHGRTLESTCHFRGRKLGLGGV